MNQLQIYISLLLSKNIYKVCPVVHERFSRQTLLTPVVDGKVLQTALLCLSAPVLTRNPNPQLRRQPSPKKVPGSSALQSHPGSKQRGEPLKRTQSSCSWLVVFVTNMMMSDFGFE